MTVIDHIEWSAEAAIVTADEQGVVRVYSPFQQNTLAARVTTEDGAIILVMLPPNTLALGIHTPSQEWWDLIEEELNRHPNIGTPGVSDVLVLERTPNAEPV